MLKQNSLSLQMKEWLCLNCQMHRTSGPPKPTQPKPIKVPVTASPQKNVQAQPSMQTLSPQQGSNSDTSVKPALSQTETCHELGHGKSESPSPQSAASAVSEKVLSFGTTTISTASDLISSAVQDEASMTPPSSRERSAVSEISVKTSTPPAPRKVVSEKDFSSKEPKSIAQQPRSEEKMSEIQTTKEQPAEVRDDGLSTCPLCNEKFNNNPPNFSTCTSCKMNVCNLCGFNPMPDHTEVRPCQLSKYHCGIVQLLHRIYRCSRLCIIKTKIIHNFFWNYTDGKTKYNSEISSFIFHKSKQKQIFR